MKKALLLVLALMLCFSLVACGENNTQVEDNYEGNNTLVEEGNTVVEPGLNDETISIENASGEEIFTEIISGDSTEGIVSEDIVTENVVSGNVVSEEVIAE